MTEEQGRIKCATCQVVIKGMPFELRIPQRGDTMRLTLYFCSMPHVKDWARKAISPSRLAMPGG